MNPVRVYDSIDVQTLAEIVEHCRAAGAAGSIVISSYNNIVVYYEDSRTKRSAGYRFC